MYALVDCNNFFVSCERVFRPDLDKVPVAVLSNNDGCIIARSNEVKALGIPMGAPRFKFENLIKSHKIQTFSSNYVLYGDLSNRLMNCLHFFSPAVEVYSIDEAFLDCKGLLEDWLTLGTRMKSSIHQWLGLPISIGFGPSKTLAKVANNFAKKSDQGVWILNSKEAIEKALAKTDIGDVWGIGRQWSKKLREKGIYTALDLSKVDPRWIRKSFTVIGERIVRELKGVSCLPLETLQSDKKSIQVSRSFSQPITTFEDLREAVATYAVRAAAKLRKANLKTSSLLVYIRTSPFKRETYYSNSTVVTLDQPTNNTPPLLKAACKGLEFIFKANIPYQKAGIMAMDLIHESVTQLQLEVPPFSPLFSSKPADVLAKEEKTNRCKKISQVLDQLNLRYGQETIQIASCGINPKWKTRANCKTPSYTTNWNQLSRVWAK